MHVEMRMENMTALGYSRMPSSNVIFFSSSVAALAPRTRPVCESLSFIFRR
jgi:hypothetical protein